MHIKEQSKEGDTVSYLFLIPDSTSFKAEIKADTAAPDTIELKINTQKELDSLLKPTTSVPSGSFNISKSLRLMFPTPIKVWDPLLISLMKDSVPVPFDVELTDSLAKTVLIKTDLKEATTYQINILPKAFIDVIFDKNRNGKWDTGNYIVKQLPEKTALYEGEIIIRSNWDKKIAWKIKR